MLFSIRSIAQSALVASLLSTQVLAASPAARDTILARQASGQQCKAGCAAFDTDFTNCGESTSCACTSAHASALQECINCSIALAASSPAVQSAVISTDQQSASLFMQLCPGLSVTVAGGGTNTDLVTLPGAISTSSGAGKTTSTAPGSASSATSPASAGNSNSTPTSTAGGTKSTNGAVSVGANVGFGARVVVVSGMVWAVGVVLAV